MNLQTLRTELNNDPLGRGYAGMTDEGAADDLNTVYRTRQKANLSGAEVYEQVDNTEFLALTAAEQAEVWDIVHLSGEGSGISITPGSKARTRFVALFGGGSATIVDILAYITEDISRGIELGIGIVTTGSVQKARAL